MAQKTKRPSKIILDKTLCELRSRTDPTGSSDENIIWAALDRLELFGKKIEIKKLGSGYLLAKQVKSRNFFVQVWTQSSVFARWIFFINLVLYLFFHVPRHGFTSPTNFDLIIGGASFFYALWTGFKRTFEARKAVKKVVSDPFSKTAYLLSEAFYALNDRLNVFLHMLEGERKGIYDLPDAEASATAKTLSEAVDRLIARIKAFKHLEEGREVGGAAVGSSAMLAGGRMGEAELFLEEGDRRAQEKLIEISADAETILEVMKK